MADLDSSSTSIHSLITQWLEGVPPAEVQHVSLSDDLLCVVCKSYFTADLLNRRLKAGVFSGCGFPISVEIWTDIHGNFRRFDRECPSTVGLSIHNCLPIMDTSTVHSAFVQRNPDYFARMSGNIYLHRLDRDRGFPILALRPDITPKRLNKGLDSLGHPLRFLDEPIAAPREQAILRAIETGQNQIYYYAYPDAQIGRTFYFKTSIILLNDIEEVIVQVEDDPDHWEKSHWQRGFWLASVQE